MTLSFLHTPHDATKNARQPLIDVCVSLAVLETLFVVAFMLSWHFNRGNNNNNTRSIYALMLAGYVFCFGGAVIGILKVVLGGAGQHARELPPATVRTMLQLIKTHELIYVISIPFPKLAVISLYLRLFQAKFCRTVLQGTALVISATALFGVVSVFANCRPFHAFWDKSIPELCTFDPMTAMKFYSIPNIATDVVMLIVPIPALYRLNISMLAKVGAACTFLISTVGIITAVLRFLVFLHVDLFSDITYNSVSTTSWSIIEPGVYLMAATVPTLRPLVRRFISKISSEAVSRHTTRPLRSRTASTPRPSNTPHLPLSRMPERPRLSKKSSSKNVMETIGRASSRPLQLDEYHNLRYGSGVFSVRSDDEESMVCADAIVYETMGRQGRNPDGTLAGFSLQPIHLSPLRTSFFFGSDAGSGRFTP
ncbi:hypothetical protein DM02DRAFT_581367 [Periconia macrospinosa]|uniref:Rhodopsin domain-containing protein n=1 Tax=Periconia macrospinosa TaxID=97972 RepID=A0A2V1EBV7_9PLEO|nr:hypothetical protein DM02DRAFT_581367 [Periconia macrospinosa]